MSDDYLPGRFSDPMSRAARAPHPAEAVQPAGPAEPLETIDLSEEPDGEPRGWIVPGLLPDRNVTDLAGDGGLGKSLLAFQLAVSVASGRPWIGFEAVQGTVLYLSCEDEKNEVLLRRNDVLDGMGLTKANIKGLHLIDLTAPGVSPELALQGEGGLLQLTDLFRRLEATIKRLQPKLVILDTRADVFGGNELVRVQVRKFVSALRGLCLVHDMATLMLSHPSVSGIQSGSGQSGSTGWGNSVRSRLYLTAQKAEGDNDQPDENIRYLSSKKNNYGPRGSEFVLRWDKGMFKREAGSVANADPDAQGNSCEMRLLHLLEKRGQQSFNTNASAGPNYGPKVFREMDKSFSKAAYRTAMGKLLDKGQIANDLYKNGSATSTRLVITGAGLDRLYGKYDDVPF